MKTETVRLIWTGGDRHSYGTRRMVAGGEFEASRRDADILILTGRAMLAPKLKTLVATVPETAAVTVEPPPVSHETDEPEQHVEPFEPQPDDPPRRPRGRPPIHGRYSRRGD